MKIAILGLGKQGVSAIKYWQKQGHEITVCDQNQALSVPQGIKGRLGNDHLSSLDQFDLIVRSPVVHPANIVKANNEAILKKVITVTMSSCAFAQAAILSVLPVRRAKVRPRV